MGDTKMPPSTWLTTIIASICCIHSSSALPRKGQGNSQAQDLPFGFWFLGHENPVSGGSSHILKQRRVRSVPLQDIIESLSDEALKDEIMDDFINTGPRRSSFLPYPENERAFPNNMKRGTNHLFGENQQILPFP